MMVGLTTDDRRDKDNRVKMKRKASRGEALLKDMIGSRKITIAETGHVADTSYNDKCEVGMQQHRSLCPILGRKEGHEVSL